MLNDYRSRKKIEAALNNHVAELLGARLSGIGPDPTIHQLYLAFMEQFYNGIEVNLNIVAVVKNSPDLYLDWLLTYLIEKGY